MPDPAPAARIGGQPASLAEAVARAAAILGASRCATIAGLATDAAGVEAAVALARRIGGALDHMHAEAALRDLAVMRQDGWIVTTPLQARARADLLLLAGPGIADAWPHFADRLRLAAAPVLAPGRRRRVILLGADAGTAALAGGGDRIDAAPGRLPVVLGVLRALLGRRKVRGDHAELANCAAALAAAAYGVVVWSAEKLDELSIAQLCGLIEDLNRTTRFAGLPLAPSGNLAGAVQVDGFADRLPDARGLRARPSRTRSVALLRPPHGRERGGGRGVVDCRDGREPPVLDARGAAGGARSRRSVVCSTARDRDHDGRSRRRSRFGAARSRPGRPGRAPCVHAGRRAARIGGAAPDRGSAAVLTLLAGGRVIDPTRDIDAPGDIWIEDGRVVAPQTRRPDARHDATGCVVMAGGIDIHSHIAGVNVNTARLLLPELRQDGALACAPVAEVIGSLYAAMGFTTVVEPAISPSQALQAQLELAQIPCIDRAILAVMGNDDAVLELLRDNAGPAAIADAVARTLSGARALGLKVINPGAAAAFKSNVRSFGLDDEVPGYGVSSRAIILALQQAAITLGLPHPMHLHCSNLGMPGNVETALATIEAAGDRPMHLAHLQFYAYGTEGERGFSSAAPRLAEALNTHPHLTADVGQVMFGQTVTVSSDVLRQFGARHTAHPKKWSIMDGDGNGGGIVPYRYRRTNFHNAVQWAAGLELFLLNRDPWRLFFTTDHPNGAPFTAYPDLLALLMSRDLRAQWIATLPEAAMALTMLPAIAREYTLHEIAIMTRAAPARLLGLGDRGHLAPGARADIAVYRPQADRAAMFREAALVFKDGRPVVREGRADTSIFGRTLAASPGYDRAIERQLAARSERLFGVAHDVFDVPEHLFGTRAEPFETVPCA